MLPNAQLPTPPPLHNAAQVTPPPPPPPLTESGSLPSFLVSFDFLIIGFNF